MRKILGFVLLTAACAPQFDPASLIKNARVLAVVATPPEAVPGTSVTLTPLVVSPTGTLSEGDGYQAQWWRCPNTDSDALGDFSQCTVPDDRAVVGAGAPYVDVVPSDVFGTFDPAVPPGAPPTQLPSDKAFGALLGYWRVVGLTMQAGARKVDAFKREPVYLPVRLDSIDARLAALDTRQNVNGTLEANTNPLLTGVLVRTGSVDGATVTRLRKGATAFFDPQYDDRSLQEYFSLKVDLAGLDLTSSAALKDVALDDLLARFERVQRCEVPVFSWFVTAGTLRRDTTLDEGVLARVFDGRAVPCPPVEGEVRIPQVQYTAPTGESGDAVPKDGVVHAWVVMRDGRGGTAVRAFDVDVK